MGRFSIRPYVCPYVRLSVHPFPPSRSQEPARQALDPASQASEPARQAPEPLWPSYLALRPGWLALRPGWLALRPAWLALGPSRGGGGQTDGWKISPFYRTSSPIGATTQKQGNIKRRPTKALWGTVGPRPPPEALPNHNNL